MKFDILQCVRVLPGAEGLPADETFRHEFLQWRGLVVNVIPEYNTVRVLWKNGAVSDWHPDDIVPSRLA